ncbi:MAG: CoB--CoM heterodisulfide reductase iron-sulfur subunit B family protein [Planctomycetia bacterium]|nr:CoB--CoM heterodisulfide reductase iron-sulfur subunit B family protein [Planctomycetia bacterium]
MKIGYYPGCALHGSSLDYEKSVFACFDRLGIELAELEDWICCGATAAHSINHKLATALPARNLGIAGRMKLSEVLAPCPMCSMELLKASQTLSENEAVRVEMESVVELPLAAAPKVTNLIQILQQYGVDELVSKQQKKLDQWRPACYYGCLLTRPPKTLKFDDCEHPSSMETLLKALGAAPVEWNYKTECCGAGLTLCDAESVVRLSQKIIQNAIDHGANCIVVACPMCQMNLDMRQADVEKARGVKLNMPILYLSDLVGLALGLKEQELGMTRHFVACKPRA